MKHFLTFLSSVLLPLACVGAPSYTTYFNNTHTYTNATVAGTSTANALVATNGVHSLGNGTGGSFVGNPADSATWWGSSDFTGLSYIDFPSEATSVGRSFYLGNYGGAINTYGNIEMSTYTDTIVLNGKIVTTGTTTKQFQLGFDPSTAPHLAFGAAILDTYLSRAAANTLSLNGDLLLRSLTATNDIIGRTITATKAFQSYQGSLTHAGTVTLDFDAALATVNQLVLTGAVTLALSNLATNRTYRLLIYNPQATNCAVTFPANTSTNIFGGAPTYITAGKVAQWSLESWGTGNATVFSSWIEN